MNKVFISPSILSADFSNLKTEISKVENGGADWLHIDVMDGHFVPNITVGVPVVKSIKRVTNLLLDVHLMIENPIKYVDAFCDAGADLITFHIEASKDKTFDTIKKIKQNNVKAGISIKPKTPIKEIEKYINEVDLILVMTVEPGFSGQKFMEDCAEKIKIINEHINCHSEAENVMRSFASLKMTEAEESHNNKNLIIQVDGGINAETAKICKSNGANCLVAGNYIYKSDDIKQAIKSLK